MIKEAIEKAVKHINLSEHEMRQVFEEIMSGKATYAQIGAFVTALRMKGETVEEITGAAKVMREKSIHIACGGGTVDIDRDDINIDEETIIDTCGTGGSGTNTFNISTTVAFVVAGCGLKVAKHGNRAASSQCGSADVLERLGVKIDVSAEITRKCIIEIGIGFLYAPLFHNAMKYAIEPRRQIGIRTIFNLLGPLSNPANATSQVLGVYEGRLTEIIARVLKNLGSRRAFVVYGMDTLDEITITGRTKVSELKGGRISNYYITPEEFGIKRARLTDIEGGSADDNARIVMSVLKGERGPRRDVVLLNAAAACVAGYKARNMSSGIRLAAESIDSGRALAKLMKLVEMTNS
ncbi:MAG: anthranilate phosphoribosyltransferase [Candidatus Omnitrophica bacterium]|nr:anthranilate phosphoribosyltransferase [Candidatus Omnitrophota bacterium]MCM8790826.1 anthranilate phosphoribosyltransferase [Candidatus Omnitrophota bacterium]